MVRLVEICRYEELLRLLVASMKVVGIGPVNVGSARSSKKKMREVKACIPGTAWEISSY